MAVYPIRLAGTWIRYSNKAIPQLINAATYQAFALRFFKCPYQAKVINTLDRISNAVVSRMIGGFMANVFLTSLHSSERCRPDALL